MQSIGLIGQNISASRSPALHTMLGVLKRIPVKYQLQEVTSADEHAFKARLTQLIAQGYSGTNVTFPFKQLAVGYADDVHDAVEKVGATNTLLFKEGKVCAFNTDYSGFIRGYRSRMQDEPAGRVLMLGAGGVGRAVAFGVFDVGATHLFVSDLNDAGAKALVQALKTAGFKATYVATQEVETVVKQVDGVVNCTPVGHCKTPGNPLHQSAFDGQRWAFDAVYTPIDTEFLQAAKKAGLKIVSGFDLFFYQALDAFELFTGAEVQDVTPVWQQFRQQYNVISELI